MQRTCGVEEIHEVNSEGKARSSCARTRYGSGLYGGRHRDNALLEAGVVADLAQETNVVLFERHGLCILQEWG